MTFSPDKFIAFPAPENANTPEKNSEIDAEIELETEKLETSIAELVKEMDAHGGMDKFKEKINAPEYSEHYGEGLIEEGEIKADQSKLARKLNAIGGSAAAVAGILMTFALEQDAATAENGVWNMVPVAIGLLASGRFAYKSFVAHIKSRVEKRKVDREKLKMKIAGELA